MKDLIVYWIKSSYFMAVVFFAGMALILANLSLGLRGDLDVRAHCEIDYQKFSSEVESISELLIYLKKNNEKTQLPHEY